MEKILTRILGILYILGAIGWVMNIIHLVQDPFTGISIARGVGIILLPLGAILGFVN